MTKTTLVLGGTRRTGSVRSQPAFVPADYAVMLLWLTGTIISGPGSRPNDDIEKVTGRPSTAFVDFARRNAPAFKT